jgi:hypothetical protein
MEGQREFQPQPEVSNSQFSKHELRVYLGKRAVDVDEPVYVPAEAIESA